MIDCSYLIISLISSPFLLIIYVEQNEKICEEIITGFLRENDIELSYLKKIK